MDYAIFVRAHVLERRPNHLGVPGQSKNYMQSEHGDLNLIKLWNSVYNLLNKFVTLNKKMGYQSRNNNIVVKLFFVVNDHPRRLILHNISIYAELDFVNIT